MHYQENLQQNVEIIQLSVHMFEESLGKKYLCWTKWDEIISEFAICFDKSFHSREKLKNVLVRKPGRKSYYFSLILS
jgi:hypothetical protein